MTSIVAMINVARWMGRTETAHKALEKDVEKTQASLKDQMEAGQTALQTQLNSIAFDLREIRKLLNRRAD